MKNKLKSEVLEWLESKTEENYSEKQILEDLQQNGCASGMVGNLIYYSDTVEFFKRNKKEIYSLVEDFLLNTGESLQEFFSHANNFPLDEQELKSETFVNGIDGLIKNNKDIADQIMNWLAWFGFEESANQYYSEKYES